jgi:hypothetical protein
MLFLLVLTTFIALVWLIIAHRGSRVALAWAVLGAVNTALMIFPPQTTPSSPWGTVARLTAINYWMSLALMAVGAILWWFAPPGSGKTRWWLAALAVSGIPFLLWCLVALLYAVR